MSRQRSDHSRTGQLRNLQIGEFASEVVLMDLSDGITKTSDYVRRLTSCWTTAAARVRADTPSMRKAFTTSCSLRPNGSLLIIVKRMA